MNYKTKKYICDNCGNVMDDKYTVIYTPEDTELNVEETAIYCSPKCVMKGLE